MTEKTANNILPKSDEDRKEFSGRMNEWLGLNTQIKSAQESQKATISRIVDSHMDRFPDDHKGDVKKRVELHLQEFLKGKATEVSKLCETVLDEQPLIEKYLTDM